ncbi:nuclear transport factor 2 family protein [Kordiimonas lacus]|uniref:SnoaL-like domain-containing protein n=1 Tax=Kordiimonas lacus TaxID=637679 RepID=A0A1G7CR77_9PROT|nr:nuclear transport factor 2 family protein [Kordiimonas lacus]SDE41731.1 hypothetical protein SAMN04488071_2905 [Kordiimonas lacus]
MMTPAELVQEQLEAYNARDLTRFLACFSDDVCVYRPPLGEPVIAGKAAFGDFYARERFVHEGLRAELVNRFVLGSKVFDHELIHGIADEPIEMAVCFVVKGGLIRQVMGFSPD